MTGKRTLKRSFSKLDAFQLICREEELFSIEPSDDLVYYDLENKSQARIRNKKMKDLENKVKEAIHSAKRMKTDEDSKNISGLCLDPFYDMITPQSLLSHTTSSITSSKTFTSSSGHIAEIEGETSNCYDIDMMNIEGTFNTPDQKSLKTKEIGEQTKMFRFSPEFDQNFLNE